MTRENEKIEITINAEKISVPRGTTILEAATCAGVCIPTLCHHEGLPPDGNCRLCTVEIEDRSRTKLVASCMYPIQSRIAISTESERVTAARTFVVQLLLNRNPKAVEISRLADEYGVKREARFAGEPDLCVRCARCVRACETNGNDAIAMARTGHARYVATPYDETPNDCVGCLSCATVCPTGKIVYREQGGIREIWGRRFELVACERCGARYATREQLAYTKKTADGLGAVDGAEAERGLCDRCRKALYGAKFI